LVSLVRDSVKDMEWTLDSAVPVVQKITAIAREHGFSVALYGSVLANGRSDNDLDLYFIVAEDRTTAVHAQACLDAIAEKLAEVKSCTTLTLSRTSRIQFRDGKRVDAQFLDGTPLP